MSDEKELGPLTRAELVAAASAYVAQGQSDDDAIILGLDLIEKVDARLSPPSPDEIELKALKKQLGEYFKNPVRDHEDIVIWVFGFLGIAPKKQGSFKKVTLGKLYEQIIDNRDPVKKGKKIRDKLTREFKEEFHVESAYLNLAPDHDARSYLETYEAWVEHACHVIQVHYGIKFFAEIDDKVVTRLEQAKATLAKRRSQKVSVEKEKAETERNSEAGGIPEH